MNNKQEIYSKERLIQLVTVKMIEKDSPWLYLCWVLVRRHLIWWLRMLG